MLRVVRWLLLVVDCVSVFGALLVVRCLLFVVCWCLLVGVRGLALFVMCSSVFVAGVRSALFVASRLLLVVCCRLVSVA